ncbi:MAG: hypothetical protein IPH13_23070 [Planctomycetes bacterium]|nr:hypothetical protein [Planctomycetota bacterium]MCC7171090.1 hypothetical protein [Planctomycetota bacterium]
MSIRSRSSATAALLSVASFVPAWGTEFQGVVALDLVQPTDTFIDVEVRLVPSAKLVKLHRHVGSSWVLESQVELSPDRNIARLPFGSAAQVGCRFTVDVDDRHGKRWTTQLVCRYVTGDVDDDGVIDAADVEAIRAELDEPGSSSSSLLTRMDIDGSGSLDELDRRGLDSFVAGVGPAPVRMPSRGTELWDPGQVTPESTQRLIRGMADGQSHGRANYCYRALVDIGQEAVSALIAAAAASSHDDVFTGNAIYHELASSHGLRIRLKEAYLLAIEAGRDGRPAVFVKPQFVSSKRPEQPATPEQLDHVVGAFRRWDATHMDVPLRDRPPVVMPDGVAWPIVRVGRRE